MFGNGGGGGGLDWVRGGPEKLRVCFPWLAHSILSLSGGEPYSLFRISDERERESERAPWKMRVGG